MNLKPLHDRVLVERVSSEDKTKGGIIIPDTAQEKPMEGKVLAVGGGARNENGQVAPAPLLPLATSGGAVVTGRRR